MHMVFKTSREITLTGKPGLMGDLLDRKLRLMGQQSDGLFDPHRGDHLGHGAAIEFMKKSIQLTAAHTCQRSHLLQAESLVVIGLDEGQDFLANLTISFVGGLGDNG